MGWLDEHIENFVKPVTGEFDRTPLGYFAPEELTVIKNTWRSIKRNAEHRTILLPGRDVFVFEILARREGYPTIFMPNCSRMTVQELAKIHSDQLQGCYLFDTGFAGSIPRGLATKEFGLLSYNHRGDEAVGKQIFPRLTFSRGLALKIEYTPKYWESARLDNDGNIVQPMSRIEDFVNAARLTIEVYTNSSARFVSRHRPISTRGGF